jgi:hypothetical protein
MGMGHADLDEETFSLSHDGLQSLRALTTHYCASTPTSRPRASFHKGRNLRVWRKWHDDQQLWSVFNMQPQLMLTKVANSCLSDHTPLRALRFSGPLFPLLPFRPNSPIT